MRRITESVNVRVRKDKSAMEKPRFYFLVRWYSYKYSAEKQERQMKKRAVRREPPAPSFVVITQSVSLPLPVHRRS